MEWSITTDCKSVALRASKVQILPGAQNNKYPSVFFRWVFIILLVLGESDLRHFREDLNTGSQICFEQSEADFVTKSFPAHKNENTTFNHVVFLWYFTNKTSYFCIFVIKYKINMKRILLIHGIFMNPLFLSYIGKNLKKNGYQVEFFSYPLFPKDKHIKYNFLKKINDYKPNVIVGHSLGGNITIHQINDISDCVEKIICLGSPLAGSSIAQEISDSFLSFIISKSIKEMLDTRVSKIESNLPVGMIAGTDNRIGMRLIFKAFTGDSDGTVALDETKVLNLKDRKELRVGHTSMLFSKDVVNEILYFIENDKFK